MSEFYVDISSVYIVDTDKGFPSFGQSRYFLAMRTGREVASVDPSDEANIFMYFLITNIDKFTTAV